MLARGVIVENSAPGEPSAGLMVRVAGAGATMIALVLVVVVVLAAVVREHQQSGLLAEHSATVLAQSQRIERHVVDLETGVRGYAATADRLFLAPWAAARASLPGELVALRQLVAGNPAQQRRAVALQAGVRSYITGYTLPFVARPRPPAGAALDAFMVRGKILLDALRARFADFDARQAALQTSLDQGSPGADRTLVAVGASAALVIAVAIAVFVAFVAFRIVVPMRRMIAACARFAAGDLGVRVPVKGRAEVAQLSRSLNDMAGQLSHRGRELEEAAQAVRQERAALDEAQRIAHVGSWWGNSETNEVGWSAELYRMFGRSPDQGPATGKQLFAYIHPDDREPIAAGYAQTIGGGLAFDLDFRILREGGVIRTLHGIGRRDTERSERYTGTVEDVTELREAESGVRRERDYAAAITRSMSEGFMLTRDGAILEVNQAMCELTGFGRDELLRARVPYPFWAPEMVEETMRRRSLITNDQWHRIETVYRHRDGTRFDASITTGAARSGDGELIGYVSTVADVSERKRFEAELQRLATHDPLTGLPNHRLFHEQLRAALARAGRHGHRLSVAVLDLDHFKSVNDRYGHPAGDKVLREAGRRLRAVVREGELIARVGGEEFAWILNAEGADAFDAAERARRAVGATPFPHSGTVTVSVGICDTANSGDLEQLYNRADQALYWAKRHGRDRTVRYSADAAREPANA